MILKKRLKYNPIVITIYNDGREERREVNLKDVEIKLFKDSDYMYRVRINYLHKALNFTENNIKKMEIIINGTYPLHEGGTYIEIPMDAHDLKCLI